MGKMLVWAEKKIYEAGNKNKLLGYRIEVVGSDNAGDIGAKTEVTKEALKRAATLGQIEVVNCTHAIYTNSIDCFATVSFQLLIMIVARRTVVVQQACLHYLYTPFHGDGQFFWCLNCLFCPSHLTNHHGQ